MKSCRVEGRQREERKTQSDTESDNDDVSERVWCGGKPQAERISFDRIFSFCAATSHVATKLLH